MWAVSLLFSTIKAAIMLPAYFPVMLMKVRRDDLDKHKQVNPAQINKKKSPSTATLIEFLMVQPLLAYGYQCAVPMRKSSPAIPSRLVYPNNFLFQSTGSLSPLKHAYTACWGELWTTMPVADFGSVIGWQVPISPRQNGTPQSCIWDS